MSALEIGRICVKTTGREAGKKCVIVDKMDKSFVLITGPKDVTGIKRRRVNIKHVEPTQHKIKIKRGATDDEVIEALKETGKMEELTASVRIESPL